MEKLVLNSYHLLRQPNLPFPFPSSSNRILCSILFCFFLARSSTFTEEDLIEGDDDDIELVVIRTLFPYNGIDRRDAPECLRHFLEVGFRIDEESLREDVIEGREDMLLDKCIRHIESLIDIECTDNRLERIGEDIAIVLSSGK